MFLLETFNSSAMPLGQMPVLEIDGKRAYQSLAIIRYLAKRVGLIGANDWETLLIDIALDTIDEFISSETLPTFKSSCFILIIIYI